MQEGTRNARRWLKRIETRYAWSLFGAIIGLVGMALAITSGRERRPEIRFTTLSESNVLDMHATVPEIDVLYEGRSIQRAKLNLKIIVLRVENSGDVDVLQTQYDQHLPWGFMIAHGQIVAIRIVNSNSSYLRATLSPQRIAPDRVAFNKTIVDRGSFVVLQVLVLHPKDSEPTVTPVGKIAGINHFLSTSVASPSSQGGWGEIFGGSSSRQLGRLAVYGMSFVLILGLPLIVVFAAVEDNRARSRDRRRRRIEAILKTLSLGRAAAKVVQSTYKDSGLTGLVRLRDLLQNKEALDTTLTYHQEFLEKVRELIEEDDEDDALEHFLVEKSLMKPSERGIHSLIDAGLVKRIESGLEVSQELLAALESLLVVL
jgi:hypothetical protein